MTTRYLFPFLLLLGLACFPAIRAQGMSDTVLRVPDPYADFQPVEIVESREDSLAILQQWQAGQMAAALDEMWEYRRQFLYESFDVKELHYKHSGPVVEGNDTVWLPLPGPGSPYVQPFRGRISSRFGFRWGRMHYGTDIALRTGDTVRAAFDGVVRIAQRNASYGYIVILFHRNGLETYYAHLSKMLVSPCQMVKAGEPIALGGNTGRSRGSHLHLEVRYLGAPLDPQYLIDFGEGKLLRDSLPICKTTLYGVSYSDAMYHKVRQGETLSSIARKYRTSVARIRVLNNMKSTRIRTGSTLRVR